jgi:hypothetical protein
MAYRFQLSRDPFPVVAAPLGERSLRSEGPAS